MAALESVLISLDDSTNVLASKNGCDGPTEQIGKTCNTSSYI